MKWKWIWIAVAAAIVLAGVWFWKRSNPRDEKIRHETVALSRGSIVVTLSTTGVVEPQNRVELKPPIGGRVEEILAREGDRVRKGRILVWMSSSERAALIDAARIKGEDEVRRWADLYKPAPLVAPIDGMIIARPVEPGQSVTTADPVLVLSDRLIVKAQVDETDIGSIRVGQAATTVLDAYPNRSIPSTVDHIAYEAKTVNNVTVYEVDVVTETTPEYMRSGMTAGVVFQVARQDDVLRAPVDAVKQDEGGSWVLVPRGADAKRPKRVEVEVGVSDGKMIEIRSGLDDGDAVIVTRAVIGKDRPASQGGNPFSPFGGGGRSRSGGSGR